MSEKFIRVIENFTCKNCGVQVKGNGFTNHCPQCLYSKHVDDNPGDRAMVEKCGGLMEPIDVLTKKNSYQIVHKCKICGHEMTTRVQDEDKVTKLIEDLKETKPFDFPINT